MEDGTMNTTDNGIRLLKNPHTAEEIAEWGRQRDSINISRPATVRKPRKAPRSRPQPLLTRGNSYDLLSIPDPRGEALDKTYRVYPARENGTGKKVVGHVKLWMRAMDGSSLTYHVRRDAHAVTCTCKGYTAHGHCKHQSAAEELGIV
jgi:hypothetical protein